MRALLFAAVSVVALLGCNEGGQQRPVVSVDQARQVAASFQGQASFTPPPRSIADIAAVLDQYKPDQAKIEASRKRADAEPPGGVSPAQLADFYYGRAQAAADVGRRGQQLSDARQAVKLGEESGHNTSTACRASCKTPRVTLAIIAPPR